MKNILELDKIRLDLAFEDVDIEKGFDKRSEELFTQVRLKASSTAFDKVCWFHLTRAPSSANFSKGVLPLNQSLNLIWDFLFSLIKNDFSTEIWNQFKKFMTAGSVSNENNLCSNLHRDFQTKINTSLHQGPYAMLIKEVAFNSRQIGNHDYLKMPEIIDDICVCFENIHKYNLREIYCANSKPCIVKFASDRTEHNYLIKSLYYLYRKYKGLNLNAECWANLDNKGKIVLPKDIKSINWIEY